MRVRVKGQCRGPSASPCPCCECQRAAFASFLRIICPLRQLALTEPFVLHPETRARLLPHTLLSVMIMWDSGVWPFNEFPEWFLCQNVRGPMFAATTFDSWDDFLPALSTSPHSPRYDDESTQLQPPLPYNWRHFVQ